MPAIGQAWVEIGARTEQFEQNVKQAAQLMDQFGRPLRTAQAETQKLTTATEQAGKAFTGFRNNAGAASVTAIGFSQGIQDIPYGLRGVVNNVQFTAQSFTQLVATTGSARAAFTALASSLAGPVGILVAFSAATVALQLWGESAGEGAVATDKLNTALEEAITLAGEASRIELGSDELITNLQIAEAAVKKVSDRITELREKQATLQAGAGIGLLAPNALDDVVKGIDLITDTELAELGVNEKVLDRLKLLKEELEIREATQKIVEQIQANSLKVVEGDLLSRQIREGQVGPGPGRPGPQISFPSGFTEDVTLEDLVRRAEREFANLPTQERIRANAAAGITGPSIGGPVIDLSKFEDLETVTARLTADMEELRVEGMIPTETEFQKMARESLRDFAFEIGDATANLILFGDSLKETLGNIGKRAAGSFLGGIVNFGVTSLLDEIPGFSTAKNAVNAVTGASQRPDFSGNSIQARLSLGDIVIEQQRTAQRNNLNLVGLS